MGTRIKSRGGSAPFCPPHSYGFVFNWEKRLVHGHDGKNSTSVFSYTRSSTRQLRTFHWNVGNDSYCDTIRLLFGDQTAKTPQDTLEGGCCETKRHLGVLGDLIRDVSPPNVAGSLFANYYHSYAAQQVSIKYLIGLDRRVVVVNFE